MVNVLLVRVDNAFKHHLLPRKITYYLSPQLPRPISIGYLSSSLVNNNVGNDVLDLRVVKPTNRAKLLKRKSKNADYVGLSFYTLGTANALKYAKIIKETNPEAKIIFGGPHASFDYRTMLSYDSVDFCVLGEGEESLVSLVKKGPEKTAGVAFKRKGVVKVNPPKVIKDIDSLPFPERDKFKPIDFKYAKHELILTSRGCPISCVHCVESSFHRTVRFRNPKLVGDELELLFNKGIRQINICDPNFTINKKHLTSICDEIINRNLSFKRILVRGASVEHTDHDRLKKLKEAGVNVLSVGVESLSPNVISFIGKTKKPYAYKNKALKLIRKATSMGFFVKSNYIVGFPYQSKETVTKEIKMLKRAGSDVAMLFLIPFPGTPLFKDYKGGVNDYWKFDFGHLLVNYSEMSDKDLLELVDKDKNKVLRFVRTYLRARFGK